jgi:hypothetical protein
MNAWTNFTGLRRRAHAVLALGEEQAVLPGRNLDLDVERHVRG